MKISPSILATNLIKLSETLKILDPKTTDLLHLDIMDGHFAPQITFGEQVTSFIKKETTIPLDVHLMVSRPEIEIPKYYSLEPHNITFHYEATHFPIRLAQEIKKNGILSGIAINPGTPASALESIIENIDLILVMSVEPGFYGQPFIHSCLSKIQALSEMRNRLNPNLVIQVDGGVTNKNIQQLDQLGVNIVVAGSFVFNHANPNHQISILKGAL